MTAAPFGTLRRGLLIDPDGFLFASGGDGGDALRWGDFCYATKVTKNAHKGLAAPYVTPPGKPLGWFRHLPALR